ncbi:hypothetical protein C8Q79DRAFT_930332 [Trametes meyenii]|nr:hypothetical protein C8Q79DRAFT_930332 [Trametes meyenii]
MCPSLDAAHPPKGKPLVIKLSWQDCTRESEATIASKAIARVSGNRKIMGHMLIVVDEKHTLRPLHDAYQTFLFADTASDPGSDRPAVNVYQPRVLHSITTESLMPLNLLMLGSIHYLSWINSIHHQDLSLNNLTYRDRGGTNYAVLDNWDLAIDAETLQTYISSEKMGTVPFMAIDLLPKEEVCGQVRHLYRHDLESFFYILVWLLFCYEDRRRLNPLPERFAAWTQGNPMACHDSKVALLAQGWRAGALTDSWGLMEYEVADYLLDYFRDLQAVWEDFCVVVKRSIRSAVGEDPQKYELIPRLAALCNI